MVRQGVDVIARMKSSVIVLRVLVLTALFSFPANGADVVADWNSAALAAIKVDKTPPPKASRALAILHVAIFDAVNGIGETYEPYFVEGKAPRAASPSAAAAAAGRVVLKKIYPAQQAAFEGTYAAALALIPDDSKRQSGIAWGEYVARRVLSVRENDGSTAVVAYTPGTNPGDWRPTPPAFAAALLPQWLKVKPFAMEQAGQFRPAPAPKLDSAVYAFDFNFTKQVGSIDSTSRTADQTAIARFWADGAGTVTPPGHWNVIARELAIARGDSLEANARLFALLNIALADAGICAWDCKYSDDFWRPVTAIRAADTDSNPDTEADPAWTPLLTTPPFPEYVSGHSTFSGAAATVLAGFFGTESMSFTTTSEDLPGVTRSFGSFWEAAAEAGLSRVFGGIHFQSANQQGLQSGAMLGRYVLENFLRKARDRQMHDRDRRGR